ncbi:MAG: DNA topoisomerase-1 [Saprospiraceae bacterium]|jgi:DNA topoisomerase-1
MAKNLVIVESPAKAKTIEKYLGKDFIVKSSVGHIRDLVKKGLGVNTETFEPEYAISEDKKTIVKDLKALAKKSDVVWLATDEDREGEAISWHLLEALGLKKEKTRRVVYNEITKEAILKAIDNPREIDINLVNAQQARRVLDRLVGFELSPVLWKKVRPSLSAGRVQSVAVKMIVEREKEILAFESVNSFKVIAHFDVDGKTILKSELPKNFETEAEAEEFLKSCIAADFKIDKLEKKPAKKSSTAPFTTSTLQQEAGRKFGYAVSQTMGIAQKLYEQGHITYMRTDSVNLSDFAVGAISDEITKSYGKDYLQVKAYKNKTKGAQEAHEAIRPTDIAVKGSEMDEQFRSLYELIWKRTIASQMSDAKFERTTVKIDVSTSEKQLVAKGEVLIFDGFLKVYMEGTDDEQSEEDDNKLLPELHEGEELVLANMNAREKFSYHPARFTESSLVKKMEENGVGRPSTYAPTISTIQKRTYVVKEDRDGYEREFRSMSVENGEFNSVMSVENTGAEKSKLFPTDIGILVSDFLAMYFGGIIDYSFTASIEKEFDEIAAGNKEWKEVLAAFYVPFHKTVEETTEKSERVTGLRELGVDPKTKKNVYARMGRYGAMVQLGETPENDDDPKPKYAGLRKEQSLSSVTFEEALDLFKLPKVVGEFNGKDLKVAIGRFGPYVQSGSLFASIPKGEEPIDLTLERAIELMEAKIIADKEKFINSFDHEKGEIQVLNGRWGPYIKHLKKNYKIPKDDDPKKLTMETAYELIKNPIKPKRGGKKKKKK